MLFSEKKSKNFRFSHKMLQQTEREGGLRKSQFLTKCCNYTKCGRGGVFDPRLKNLTYRSRTSKKIIYSSKKYVIFSLVFETFQNTIGFQLYAVGEIVRIFITKMCFNVP